MEQKINDAITLLEEKSYLRSQLFKVFSINTIDGIRFYYSMGKRSQIPVIGRFFKVLMEQYYKYVHTSAIKLPLKDIEEVINQSDHVSVGRCPCRVIFDNCDDPVMNCIKINSFSRMTTKLERVAKRLSEERGMKVGNKHSRKLTKDEAIEIVRNSRKRNMIISLESCIQPYQNNICNCCTDCCIELNLRYKYGLKVSPRGPYMPVIARERCTDCLDCVERCPVDAITRNDKGIAVDMKKCLGCGLCAENCPGESIEMKIDETSSLSFKRPGPFKMIYIYLLSITMFAVFLVCKLRIKSENVKYHLAEPRESDSI